MKTKSLISKQRMGFGAPTETIQSYAQNFLKQNHNYSREIIQQHQDAWRRVYTQRIYEYSLQDLLQCEHEDLSIVHYPKPTWTRSSHQHLQPIIIAQYGFWHLGVSLDTLRNEYDFTLSVNCGNAHRFQPNAIKRDITKKYGNAVYEIWRSMVLDDIVSLRRLVEVVRSEINFVVPSIVCCPSSRRLCERAGIYVQNDVAFLFPSCYS